MARMVNDDSSNGPGTTVGVNVALSGTLKDQNDIAVFGMVEGEVISEKSISIGQSAQVKGPVHGKVVTVSGTVRGSIKADEKLEGLETGKVFGSIIAKDLIVHSGAILVGKCDMPTEEEAPVEDKEADVEGEPEEVEDLLKPEVEEL